MAYALDFFRERQRKDLPPDIREYMYVCIAEYQRVSFDGISTIYHLLPWCRFETHVSSQRAPQGQLTCLGGHACSYFLVSSQQGSNYMRVLGQCTTREDLLCSLQVLHLEDDSPHV